MHLSQVCRKQSSWAFLKCLELNRCIIIFPLQNQCQNIRKEFCFVCRHVCLFTIQSQNTENALISLWMDEYIHLPKGVSKSVSDKSYPCISDEMGKGCCFPGRNDTKSVFVGTSEALEGSVWGCCQVVGSPVLLRQGASLSQSTWTTCNACQDSRRVEGHLIYHQLLHAITSFLVLFIFPHQHGFSDLLTAFSMTSAAIRKRNKEA